MITKKGYICTAKLKTGGLEFIFGKNTDERYPERFFENLESQKEISFYQTKVQAELCRSFLSQKDYFNGFKIAEVKINIAEDEKDLEQLSEEDSLIAIKKANGLNILMGPAVKSSRTAFPLPGTYLVFNGFKTHDNFKDAKNQMLEIKRQGGEYATIASFYLNFL